MTAPLPAGETERLKALRNYDILDTGAEKQFDDIALLASLICGTPIAMISLVDENREWFKSKVGMTQSETARDIAFCAHGILQAEVFIVPDAQADERFATNPLVTGDSKIRFYAGAPLIDPEGHALGMICVHDQVPRELSAEQTKALQALSRQVVSQLELRRSLHELQETVLRLRQAEDSLQLFRSAVEQSRESIMITDAQIDAPGPRIVYVNSAFTHMTGHTRLEPLGRTPRMLQGPRTDRAVLDRLRRNLKQGENFEGETINYRKDGSEFDVEWQVAPIRQAGGSITHFVAIQRDITERKQLESRLFQSQKMETVGKLAGGVAHEFNSILTAIIGQSELLLTDLPANDPLVKNAGEIHDAARRAAVLTRQLLAYGRKQILAPEILNLNLVLHEMADMLRHLVGAEIDVRIVPGTGLKPVKIDPGQMEQVIVNIAMNAADVMPNGGKLTLETANVTLAEDYVRPFGIKGGDYVMLAMSDLGPGMSEEVKARAFEPFFSTKAAGRGTGLGLASCYGIIKQSEGHLAIDSEVGRGTTLKIYLPQVDERVPAPPARATPPELPRGTETILLAEDDPSLLEMSATLLRRLGYTVLTADSGVEALNMEPPSDAGPIDLLYTDVAIPQMSGTEWADRIRTIYPKTRILFTSAYTESAMGRQGVMHLQKPFTPLALARKVREVLDAP